MSDVTQAAELLVTALSEVQTWSDRPTVADLAALPGCPALYLLTDANAAPVLLATTQSLKRVLVSRLTDRQRRRPGKADLAEIVRGVRWRRLATPFEGRWWYYRMARALYPQEYRRLISFGPAWFLHVNWNQRVPELHVSDHVWCTPGQFVGPWPTHAACRATLEGLWDLFDLCRYPEQVRKAPDGTRCAYADMGRCDAPCDGSVPLSTYVHRCRAAWGFVTGDAGAWIEAAAVRMKEVAAAQQYERAALIREQLRFAETWRAQWTQRVQPAEQMHYLLGFPATRRRAWKLLHFRAGQFTDGPVRTARRLVPDAVAWLNAQLAQPAGDVPPTVRMEQTWLMCQVLGARERDAAQLASLPAVGLPAGLEEALGQWAARWREDRPRVEEEEGNGTEKEPPASPGAM